MPYIVHTVHVATFTRLVGHVSMFYLERMVVKFTSIIDTYRATQTRYQSSMSYTAYATTRKLTES